MKPDSEGIILRTGLQSSNSMKPVLRRYGQRRFFSLLRQQLFENRENRSPINMNCVRVFCDTKTTAGGVGLIWGPPGPRSWQWALGVWDGHRQDRGPGGGEGEMYEMGTAGTEVLAVGSGALGWAPPGPRSWRWALGVWDWDRRDRGPGGGLWGLGGAPPGPGSCGGREGGRLSWTAHSRSDVHQCSSKAIQLYSVAEALDAASA